MEEFYIQSDGIALHAKLDKPEGAEKCPLCIVVHGFTGHMEERHIIGMAQTINEAGIASLRVEMYGHGQSDGQFEDHTLYKWVTNILAVIDYVKTLPFVTDLYITGHSQGGLLTMLAAGMHPDLFKAILPISPAWMIPEMARKGELLGVTFDPEHIPAMIYRENSNVNGNYIRVAQMIHVEDAIARFRGPVLIVQGDEDEAVPIRYAFEAEKLYQNCKLVVVPGDDHCFNNHLDQMLAAMKEYLIDINQ